MSWFPVRDAIRMFSGGQPCHEPSSNEQVVNDAEMGQVEDNTDPAAAWTSTHHSDHQFNSQPPSTLGAPAMASSPSSNHYDPQYHSMPPPTQENSSMHMHSGGGQSRYPFDMRRPSARPVGSGQSFVSTGGLLDQSIRRMASGGNWGLTSGHLVPYSSASYGLTPLVSTHQHSTPMEYSEQPPTDYMQQSQMNYSQQPLGLTPPVFNFPQGVPDIQPSLPPSACMTPDGSYSTLQSGVTTPSEQRTESALSIATPRGPLSDIETSTEPPQPAPQKKRGTKPRDKEDKGKEDTQLKDKLTRLKSELKKKEERHRQEMMSMQKDLQKMAEGFQQMDEIKNMAVRWKNRAEEAERELKAERERKDEEDVVKATLVSDQPPTSHFSPTRQKVSIPRYPSAQKPRPRLIGSPPTFSKLVPSTSKNVNDPVSYPTVGNCDMDPPSDINHGSRHLSPGMKDMYKGGPELSGGDGEDEMSENRDVAAKARSKGKTRASSSSERTPVETSSVVEPITTRGLLHRRDSRMSSGPPVSTRFNPQSKLHAGATFRYQMPTPNEYCRLPLEEKLNHLYAQGFKSTRSSIPGFSKAPKPHRSGFKEPRKRAPRGEDKNKILEWVRDTINVLLGIKSTSELLTHADIFPADTPLQQRMKVFDDNGLHQRPSTEPMKVCWEVIHSPWNEALFQEFKKFGLEEGEMLGLEEEEEMYEMFFAWLKRIRVGLWSKRPVDGETPEQTNCRMKGEEAAKRSEARRNACRNELYCARMNTILDRIPYPDDIDSQEELNNETKVWIDAYKVVDTLGIEGQSSDESEAAGSATIYYAKQLEWRSTKVGRRLRKVDKYRTGLNSGGSCKPGTVPRDRRRRNNPTLSSRKPPSGLARNLYASAWYQGLSLLKIADLNAKGDLQLATSTENL